MKNEKLLRCIAAAERLLPDRPYQEAADLGCLDRWWRDAFQQLMESDATVFPVAPKEKL